MLSVPSSFWQDLNGSTCRPVEVFELELDAGTLYYSSQALTWNSQSYSALAVKRSEIREEMAFRVPETTITFSNVSNILRSYFEPDDLLTGRWATVRLLMRDSSETLRSDSLVLFRGVMDRPRRITERDFAVKIIGPLKGHNVAIPRRRTATWCPWQFKDGVHCTYSGTDTTCTREWSDCDSKSNTHEFGGFLAPTALSRLRYRQAGFQEAL